MLVAVLIGRVAGGEPEPQGSGALPNVAGGGSPRRAGVAAASVAVPGSVAQGQPGIASSRGGSVADQPRGSELEALPTLPPPRRPLLPTAPPSAGLTLEGAITAAIASSPDLRSASERLQFADATLRRARAEFFPKLTVAEAFINSNIPAVVFFLELNQRRFSLTQNLNNPGFINNFSTLIFLQQNLYAGGRRSAEADAAQARLNASGAALAATQNELVFHVAEAYYRLHQARELVESRAAAVKQIERHRNLVDSRFRAGTAVRSDVLTVEVRLAEVQEGLITATNQLELGWAVLENVTGCRLPHDLPREVPPPPWSGRATQLELAIREALDQRGEVREAAENERAAAHDARAAAAGKKPSVDFLGNFSTFDINASSGGNGMLVAVFASMNLFDGHRTKTEVERAKARMRELQAKFQRLLLDIELDVRQAYLFLNDSEARLQVASRAIAQADETVREIESRYRGQVATITQLVDAQVAATNARIRLANASADVEIARAALERATGQLVLAGPR